MTITLTLKGVLLTIIAILGIVALAYLIVIMANLAKTLKKTNAILDDAKAITEVAADKAQKLDGAIDGLAESAAGIADALKGNKSVIAAATSVVNAASSVAGVIKKSENKKKSEDK